MFTENLPASVKAEEIPELASLEAPIPVCVLGCYAFKPAPMSSDINYRSHSPGLYHETAKGKVGHDS
jgi:hypothetical protein